MLLWARFAVGGLGYAWARLGWECWLMLTLDWWMGCNGEEVGSGLGWWSDELSYEVVGCETVRSLEVTNTRWARIQPPLSEINEA